METKLPTNEQTNDRQTEDIDFESLFSKEGRHKLETEDELVGLSYDTSEEDEEEDELSDETDTKKRNRLIGNIMLYSGIAILIVLCIVTGVLLFMGQSEESIQALRFEEHDVTLRAGHTVSLKVVTEPSDVKYAVSYSSSDEKVATVENGVVKGVKQGNAVITAKSGELIAECKVTVERDALSSFEISQSKLEMMTGDDAEVTLTFTPADAADKKIVWSSSDENVAKVKDGKITAEGSGEATVTVKDEVSGISRDIAVTVSDPEKAESMAFSETELTLNVGESYETTLIYEPDNIDTKYSVFYTSDRDVASVDEYGVITANSAGECRISAVYYYDDSITAEIALTVIDPFVITTPPESSSAPEPVLPPVGSEPVIETVDGITYVNGIMIANKTYSLPADYDPGVQDDAINAFYEMQSAAYQEGLELYIVSGYRSYDTQYGLYWGYVESDGQAEADRYSARPGHSEHQTGYAFDLNWVDYAFANTPEGIWLKDNCWKYGFIIRYPEGKEDVTGYMYEPWHVRWLGKDIAKTVYESGLTLEEYLGISSVYQD